MPTTDVTRLPTGPMYRYRRAAVISFEFCCPDTPALRQRTTRRPFTSRRLFFNMNGFLLNPIKGDQRGGVWSRESGVASLVWSLESGLQDFRISTPDSRLPTPDSRLPTPDSRLS